MKQVAITKSRPPEVLQIRDAPDPIPRAGVWRLDADKIAQKFPIDGEQWATGIRDIDCLDWSPADAAQITNARRRSADILTAAIARHLATFGDLIRGADVREVYQPHQAQIWFGLSRSRSG